MSDEEFDDSEFIQERQEEMRGYLAELGAAKPQMNIRHIYVQLAELNNRLTILEVAKLNKRVAMLEGWVDTAMRHLATLGIDPVLIELEANLPHWELKNGEYVKEEI